MNDYEKMLQRLIERTKTLLTQLDGLHDIPEDEIRNPKLIQAALSGELLAKNLRKLLICSSATEKSTLYHQVCVTDGFDVTREVDDTVIILPPLPLKERKYSNYQYIIDPLFHSLETYVSQNHPPKYDRCIVRFKHIFPADTPVRRLHDYDNLEMKKILDALSLFLMIDDNIQKCHVYHLSETGESMKTEIRISPMDGGDKTDI